MGPLVATPTRNRALRLGSFSDDLGTVNETMLSLQTPANTRAVLVSLLTHGLRAEGIALEATPTPGGPHRWALSGEPAHLNAARALTLDLCQALGVLPTPKAPTRHARYKAAAKAAAD